MERLNWIAALPEPNGYESESFESLRHQPGGNTAISGQILWVEAKRKRQPEHGPPVGRRWHGAYLDEYEDGPEVGGKISGYVPHRIHPGQRRTGERNQPAPESRWLSSATAFKATRLLDLLF